MALIMEFMESELVSNNAHNFCNFISAANLSHHGRHEGK